MECLGAVALQENVEGVMEEDEDLSLEALVNLTGSASTADQKASRPSEGKSLELASLSSSGEGKSLELASLSSSGEGKSLELASLSSSGEGKSLKLASLSSSSSDETTASEDDEDLSLEALVNLTGGVAPISAPSRSSVGSPLSPPPVMPRKERSQAGPPPVASRKERSQVGPPPVAPRKERSQVGPPPVASRKERSQVGPPPVAPRSSGPPPRPMKSPSRGWQSAAAPPSSRGKDAAGRKKSDSFDPMELVEGDTFTVDGGGRYRVMKELGRGNMGVVFHAQRMGRSPCDVALKFVLDVKNIDSLVQEYGFARMLNGHRYVAESNVLDTVEGIPFGEFQFIKGMDLENVVDLHKLGDIEYCVPQLLVAWSGWQTAEALMAAHEIETGKEPKGIIHKDVKPGNIMIDINGTVKVLDFGLAQSIAFAREEILAGRVSGTPVIIPSEMLMRPEIFSEKLSETYGEVWGDGSHLVDGRADVFSLACTMYFMLTRHYPSMPDGDHENALVAINELHHTPLNPPHMLVPSVSPVLSKIVYLGIHPDPRLRLTAKEFHRFLGAFIYPNTIGQGLFASDVHAYICLIQKSVSGAGAGPAAERIKEKFERAPNIIQASASNYVLHDELEKRFEKARALDLGGLQKKKKHWRNIAKLPLPWVVRGGDQGLHDVFTPLVYSDDCVRLRMAGKNPARVRGDEE